MISYQFLDLCQYYLPLYKENLISYGIILWYVKVCFMNNFRNRTIIRPKLSTMPRNKSEASSQLELYQMVTEKQRIHRELYVIKERTHLLQQRLVVLNKQIKDTENKIEKLRNSEPGNSEILKQTVDIKHKPAPVNDYVDPSGYVYDVLEIKY